MSLKFFLAFCTGIAFGFRLNGLVVDAVAKKMEKNLHNRAKAQIAKSRREGDAVLEPDPLYSDDREQHERDFAQGPWLN